MASDAQMNANRRNAQKSTGPKTAEGKAVVAQNATKHGLFAQKNVIQCENRSDFDCFREELLDGLSPAGSVETMLAERIVSLSWRLKRVERMNSEIIDVKIARIESDSWDQNNRRRAGLLDTETGKSELALGWAVMRDFSDAQVLERLLIYEKRIESSLYKAMDELKKLQQMRKKEHIETMNSGETQPSPSLQDEAATPTKASAHREQDALDIQGRDALATEMKKQTQSSVYEVSTNSAVNEKTKPICALPADYDAGGR